MSLTATTKALPPVTAGVVGSATVWKPIWGRVPLVILLRLAVLGPSQTSYAVFGASA